ncbi:MAG TPA: hypothetical protein VFM19_08150 [Candidatus Limnocylindria bacterium]|nr:hypothetical protein [Candidatus Limnocylindria bacterium]
MDDLARRNLLLGRRLDRLEQLSLAVLAHHLVAADAVRHPR